MAALLTITPPHELFEGMIFLPIALSLLVWILLLVTIVVIRCAYFCYRRQVIIVRENAKIYRFVFSCFDKLEKLNVLVFPRLFTEKILQSGTREWKEVLFLGKHWPEYQGSKNPKMEFIMLFASFAITIICISAIGFFRNFPIISWKRSTCLEQRNNFDHWYCYDNTSSQPLDCEEYVRRNEPSNSVKLKCYAFSLDIGMSFAVAFGLYKLSSLVIYGIVFLRNCFGWMCRKCKMPVACGIYCYIAIVSLFWFIATLCLLIDELSIDTEFLKIDPGEYFYRIVLDSIPFVFVCFTLIIPLRIHHYGVDEWPTYNCLSTADEEAEVELTPCIVNDHDNSQYSPIDDKTS